MSNNDYILNLLNTKGHNIYILNNIEEMIIKKKNHKIIEEILTYKQENCPCCGVINNSSSDIIK